MPFVYRHRPVNINRTTRRPDENIHGLMLASLEDISKYRNSNCINPDHIPILPMQDVQVPVSRGADPREFLALDATKLKGLSWYEVEYWLDVMRNQIDPGKFYASYISSLYLDERRRLYKFGSTYAYSIIYRK